MVSACRRAAGAVTYRYALFSGAGGGFSGFLRAVRGFLGDLLTISVARSPLSAAHLAWLPRTLRRYAAHLAWGRQVSGRIFSSTSSGPLTSTLCPMGRFVHGPVRVTRKPLGGRTKGDWAHHSGAAAGRIVLDWNGAPRAAEPGALQQRRQRVWRRPGVEERQRVDREAGAAGASMLPAALLVVRHGPAGVAVLGDERVQVEQRTDPLGTRSATPLITHPA